MTLKTARIERGLTITQLARKLKIARSTLWRYENNKIAVPLVVALRMKDTLRCSFKEMEGWVTDEVDEEIQSDD